MQEGAVIIVQKDVKIRSQSRPISLVNDISDDLRKLAFFRTTFFAINRKVLLHIVALKTRLKLLSSMNSLEPQVRQKSAVVIIYNFQ